MKRDEYNYWLANINNIGTRKIQWLLSVYGDSRSIYHTTKSSLLHARLDQGEVVGAKLSEKDIDGLLASKNEDEIKMEYEKLWHKGIRFITKEDDGYPSRLKKIYDPPYALYVKGKLPEEEGSNKKYLSVIGARDCSVYGREIARYFSAAIAKEGIPIISGLARGIDAHAHEGALSVGGVTYGVLGCGIDICYPKENFNLYMEMMKEGGIISEYPPGTQPLAGYFPMRNRLISGLSDGILVIEAKEKSGSLITVDMGLDQGKDIYALPGKVTDRLSEGCNNLIKMGAKLVTNPKDILEDFIVNYEQIINALKNNNNVLESDEKIVYAILDFEPKHIEELAVLTGLPMDTLLEQLFIMELKGLIHQANKNYYVLQRAD